MTPPPPYETTWCEKYDLAREQSRCRAAKAATVVPDAITRFLAHYAMESTVGKEQADVLYRTFVNYIRAGNWPERFLPSRKEFCTVMATLYPKHRTRTGVFYCGLALLPEPSAPFVFERDDTR